MKGKDGLVLTGQLGDVMKESARIALSYVRGHAEELGIADDAFDGPRVPRPRARGRDPEGRPERRRHHGRPRWRRCSPGARSSTRSGMTGEVTLQGRVLPIGGLKQKVLAAHAAGLTTVILPERNRGDLDDVPQDVREAMSFHPVVSIDEVLELGFGACAEYGGCVTAAFRRYGEGGGEPSGGRRRQPLPPRERPAHAGAEPPDHAALPALPGPAHSPS